MGTSQLSRPLTFVPLTISQTILRIFTSDSYVTEDFFRDLQEEFRNWEASASSQGKPKSLWEELAVRLLCALSEFHETWNGDWKVIRSHFPLKS